MRSSAIQSVHKELKSSSPTRRLPSRSWGPIRLLVSIAHPAQMPDGPAKRPRSDRSWMKKINMQNFCTIYFESININENVVYFNEITTLKNCDYANKWSQFVNKEMLLVFLNVFQLLQTLTKQTTKNLECTENAIIDSQTTQGKTFSNKYSLSTCLSLSLTHLCGVLVYFYDCV